MNEEEILESIMNHLEGLMIPISYIVDYFNWKIKGVKEQAILEDIENNMNPENVSFNYSQGIINTLSTIESIHGEWLLTESKKETSLKDLEDMLCCLTEELMKLRVGFIKSNTIRDITHEEVEEYY